MRIFNAEPVGYAQEAKALLRSVGELVEAECSRESLKSHVADVDVLIVRLGHFIDEEILDCAKSLRIIVSATTGLNHIDLSAATARGITVLSLKGERAFLDTVTATAEHAWGMLLALARHLPAAVTHVHQSGWDRDLFRGRQLSGLTLGIVGLGRLGTMIVDYAKAFRMQAIATDITPLQAPDHVTMMDLPGLLANSDVLCLLPNYQESSHHLIGVQELSVIKPGALLINVSRGEVIDEEALLDALQSGRLAGAALDVLAGEAVRGGEWLERHPLVEFARHSDRLLITPHIGGATTDSMRLAEVFMARKLVGYLGKVD